MMILVVIFFMTIFLKLYVCFVVAVFDLVHIMEAIYGLC